MSMLVKDIKKWLDTVGDWEFVGVDEGGLTLVVEKEPPVPYLEIGGAAKDDDVHT